MVVVYGTVCLDRAHRVPRLPEKGAYVEIESAVVALGGEAANTALALSRWGVEVALAGNPIGSGIEGALLRRLLVEAGLPVDRVPGGDIPTPVCDIYVTPDGDRTMFGRGFAEMEATSDPSVAPFLLGAWFTTDPNHGERAREAALRAERNGMRVYLMDFAEPGDQVPFGSYWQSSTNWVGVRGGAQQNEEWLRTWVKRHGCSAVLTDGVAGFWAGSPRDPVRHYPAFACPGVVDTTGAGDVFRAAMLYGLERGWPWGECLKFAAAAGCLNSTALGASTAIPTLDEVRALIAAQPDVAAQYD